MSDIQLDTRRQRLPNRRAAETFDLQADGQHYRATIGRFPENGQLAEIFIANSKSGSQADCSARDASVVVSIALQFGVPVDVQAPPEDQTVDFSSLGALSV